MTGIRQLQTVTVSTTGTTLAYGSNVTKGSVLISATHTTLAAGTPTDTIGNTWTLAATNTTGSNVYIWYAQNKASGANTVTIGNNSSGWALWEITSGAPSTPRSTVAISDRSANASGTSVTIDAGAVTPRFADSFIVMLGSSDLSAIPAGSAPWTDVNIGTSTLRAQTLTLSGLGGAQDASFTISNDNWRAVIASFGFPSAAGAPLRARAKPFLV